jgi:hypothetical protein
MQQAGGTGVIISVRDNDTMMMARAHSYILDFPAEEQAP